MLLFIGFIGLGRPGEGDTLRCASCEQFIAPVGAICQIMGRPPRKVYQNPAGLLCPTVTLSSAVGLTADERSCVEHTWFDGYAWQAVACASCELFLGWRFEAAASASPPVFFGLLEQRLISKGA